MSGTNEEIQSQTSEEIMTGTKEENQEEVKEVTEEKPKDPRSNIITLEDMALHCDVKSGVWISIHGRVYDITKFLEEVYFF